MCLGKIYDIILLGDTLMKEQLNKILKLLEDNHINFYANITKAELKNYIKELLMTNELQDKYDLYYIVSKIIKKALNRNDSHTTIFFKNGERVPLKFAFFDDKLYVVDAKNKDLIYSQVLEINNIDIKEILFELEQTITYSTNGWKEFSLARDISSISKLRSLKILNKPKELEYTFLNKGVKEKRMFNNQSLDSEKIQNYTFSINNDIMHIIYNSCENEEKMNELVDIIKKHLEIKYYIIDLRDNIGGNSNIIKPLIEVLKGKKIITLVNKKVYSSGIFAIVDLKNIGSIFVGTEVGSSINCFCNVKRIELDEFIIMISYRYYYLDENTNKINTITTKDEYDKLDNKYKDNYFFKPDYYVEECLDDLKNHKDVYMSKALEVIKKI